MSREIQTFVFFDLETTGINAKSRITELSMVAISRKDLVGVMEYRSTLPPSSPLKSGAPSLPRVVHKLTRLFYPNTFIHPEIENVTGLSNENLLHLPPFDAKSASAIKLFLDLPAPVCLIAHNGNDFDFPILRAELINCNSDILEGVLCADSLLFARYYEKEDIRIATELANDFKDDDDIYILPEIQGEPCDILTLLPPLNDDATLSNISHDFNPLPVYKTPEKSTCSKLRVSPYTPVKKSHSYTNGISTPDETKVHNSSRQACSQKSNVCRNLKYDIMDMKKRPFSQPNLYRRLFRSEYNAHRAEDDATALLQICCFHGESFVKWVDANNSSFSTFDPRWKMRKSFTLL